MRLEGLIHFAQQIGPELLQDIERFLPVRRFDGLLSGLVKQFHSHLSHEPLVLRPPCIRA